MRLIPTILILLALCSCATHYRGADAQIVKGFDVLPGQALLVVRVESTEYTGNSPYECPEDVCIPFYFWYKYEAEVLDVVKGNFNTQKLSFAVLHHANYVKEVTDEWYILIEKFDKKSIDELGVQYRVVQHDAKAFYNE
ncbi:hypothetical protein K0J45_14095 [Shewanella alkalitolerans]|uniref:hypothetical protein n=1 Tax=Shewanella alkalitolerans TaxID=2864209 RepID=UPI001C661F6F|nr:hypothetical protein [Shewanella alkalitolerans]QYJ96655.1 hypothetical protein K0J45_14095 [Shewanella alkalitolerans]